jgi:type II restriction enzyme
VIWLKAVEKRIVCAFEIEKSTSIYSGILRMEDLARSLPGCACSLYLVAPRVREGEVMAQLSRPAFRNDLADISLSYIPFDDLSSNADAIARFGDDHTMLTKICKCAPRTAAVSI